MVGVSEVRDILDNPYGSSLIAIFKLKRKHKHRNATCDTCKKRDECWERIDNGLSILCEERGGGYRPIA